MVRALRRGASRLVVLLAVGCARVHVPTQVGGPGSRVRDCRKGAGALPRAAAAPQRSRAGFPELDENVHRYARDREVGGLDSARRAAGAETVMLLTGAVADADKLNEMTLVAAYHHAAVMGVRARGGGGAVADADGPRRWIQCGRTTRVRAHARVPRSRSRAWSRAGELIVAEVDIVLPHWMPLRKTHDIAESLQARARSCICILN